LEGQFISTASDTITLVTLATIRFVVILICDGAILTNSRKSNRLAESSMASRVQTVLCMLDESKTIAEDHVSQLKLVDEKIENQSKASDLILSNVKSGITSLWASP
jgi:hypothetical protein